MEHGLAEGVLGTEYDRADRSEVQAQVKDAHEAAKDEAWAGYRFIALGDSREKQGLKIIDLCRTFQCQLTLRELPFRSEPTHRWRRRI
jgi:hypothetical protein